MGRAMKNPEERRNRVIRVLATRAQHEELQTAAEAANKSLSAFLLQLGLRAARTRRKQPKKAT